MLCCRTAYLFDWFKPQPIKINACSISIIAACCNITHISATVMQVHKGCALGAIQNKWHHSASTLGKIIKVTYKDLGSV